LRDPAQASKPPTKEERSLDMRIPRYLPVPVMLFVSLFVAALRPE
jgi:hypothetical protein